MKICFAQVNPTVGDIDGNTQKIVSSIQNAKEKADIILFPELAITGYPPKDLLLKKSIIKANLESLEQIRGACENIIAVVGFADKKGKNIFNAAAIIKNKEIIGIHHKIHLPNYDVFDEKRYFSPGKKLETYDLPGTKIGVTICEDIWKSGPVEDLKKQGAELILNISASPYTKGKEKIREKEVIGPGASKNKINIAYCNLVGGQDDLLFDGHSYFFDESGKKVFEAPGFEEGLFIYDTEGKEKLLEQKDEVESVYKALILGVKDYFRKNGFKKAILGLSGGIDSALTAVLAVEALGKENVLGITMPSMYSSRGSVDDSSKLSKNLGIKIREIPIKQIFDSFELTLADLFKGTVANVAEENIQARIRGNILMAMSNKFGYIVLSTGNKSELAVGYCTLYGDMSGGLAVISDVPKTLVYALAEWYNKYKGKEAIPREIITKDPSAELRPNQKDSDSLPDYNILDQILELYEERKMDPDEIIKKGFDKETVAKVVKMIKNNEYKRYQAALGLKVTTLAFGSGRRMPITNKWKS